MSQRSILAAFALLLAALPAAAAPRSCDRACMTALADQYLAALVKHDPAGMPLARGVRFTENTAEILIGDGLWVGASADDCERHENGGQIHEIEAMGVSLPYGTKSGWE